MASNTPSTPAPCKGTVKRSFLFNSVLVKLVPYKGRDTHPNGNAFYVNSGKGGVIGVRVYPNGRKVAVNTQRVNWHGKHGKAEYLQFSDAWGCHKYILASRAVYIAWRGPIEEGMTIDHIDGCTTNNDFRNLRCLTNAVNNRDGGFLRILRNKGINTTAIQRWMLLRYFLRMATIKPALGWRYYDLTKDQLSHILYDADEDFNLANFT